MPGGRICRKNFYRIFHHQPIAHYGVHSLNHLIHRSTFSPSTMKHHFLFVLCVILASSAVLANDPFCRVWFSEDSLSKIQIYKAVNGNYFGKIVWMKDGYENGKPLVDNKNPNKALRGRPFLNMPVVLDLERKNDTQLTGGKVYDPTSGNYYNCKMTYKHTYLELRGYIWGMSFLGRTTKWWLAE